MEAPLSSFLKKLISVELQNRKEYQRQQEEGYLGEAGKKAMQLCCIFRESIMKQEVYELNFLFANNFL